MSVTRREFIRETAAVAGGLAAAPLLLEESHADPVPAAMPERVLGRIGKRVPLIGYGTAPLGSDNTPPEAVTRILNAACDMGITYFDTAPVYGSRNTKYGTAEMKMKGFLKTRRDKIFLVTKVNVGCGQTRDGAIRMLQESLKDMGTDHADLVHIHNLGDFDMQRLMAEDGVLAGLEEAKKRGLLRYIGVSGHMRPARFVRLIETGKIDLTMVALNFADRNNYDFEGLVLPAAKKQNTAVVAMKVLGGTRQWSYDGRTQATLGEYHERAIRYALGLPVACAVIGFNNEAETRQAVEVARRYKPLSAQERDALLEEGRRIAKERGLYYGPVTG